MAIGAPRELCAAVQGELRGRKLERLAALEDLAGALVGNHHALQGSRIAPVVAEVRADDEVLAGAILQPDGGPRLLEEPGRQVDGPPEHLIERLGQSEASAEVEERVGDLERGSRAVGFEPLGLVEARVLERHGRVAAEHLEKADVVLVELVDPELRDDDRPDDTGAVVERDCDHRLVDVLGARDRDRRSRSRGRSRGESTRRSRPRGR